MVKNKIGAITIGQSPRVDVTNDLNSILSPNIELVECGALDPYSYDEIQKLVAPEEGDYILISRMKDGREVKISERKVIPLIQECINKLEKENCKAILMLCTHSFPQFQHKVSLIEPSKIINEVVKSLVDNGKIANIMPNAKQIAENEKMWRSMGIEPVSVAASPYNYQDNLEESVKYCEKENVNLIYLNCIGYTIAMKNAVKKISKKPVILPRTILANILNEMYM